MNKKAVLLAAAAVVVIAAALVLVTQRATPQFPKFLNLSNISYPNGVYVYDVYVGNSTLPLTYVEYNGSVLLASSRNGTTAYLLLSRERVAEYYRTNNSTIILINYPDPLGFSCTNFTSTQIIEGVAVTVANRLCSAQQFSALTSFPQIASALSQVPPPQVLALKGVASTPFGPAAVYTNSTTMPYLFYTINFTYYIYLLTNKVIYKYSILISIAQYTYNVTYLLRSMQPLNATYLRAIGNLSSNLPIKDMGGLSLANVAEKIGMVVSKGQPTILAFLGLNDTSSARLLVENYTLFNNVGLIILDPPNQPLIYAERLRCLYSSLQNKSALVDVLRDYYRGLLSNAPNIGLLPNKTCPVPISAESALLNLALQGIGASLQSAPLPVLIVIYPNGTYTAITGYNPSALKAALGK